MRSTPQAKKDALIADLVAVRENILNAASDLPVNARSEVFLGIWSVKDLLAHLVGWDHTNVEAVKAILAGEIPSFYAHYDRDWQTYNARLVAEYKRGNFAQLLRSVKASHRLLVDYLKPIPAGEFGKDQGLRVKGSKVTIARILQAEINDERIHHQQIEEFKKRAA